MDGKKIINNWCARFCESHFAEMLLQVKCTSSRENALKKKSMPVCLSL